MIMIIMYLEDKTKIPAMLLQHLLSFSTVTVIFKLLLPHALGFFFDFGGIKFFSLWVFFIKYQNGV